MSGNVAMSGTSSINSAGTHDVKRCFSGGALTSGGVGTLILTNAANTYTGVTNIANGTLQVVLLMQLQATDMTITAGGVFN